MFGGKSCPPLEENRFCQIEKCPIDCIVGEWSPYSNCSRTCSNGEKFRTRPVIKHPMWGGKECPPVT